MSDLISNEPDPFDEPSEGGFIGKETMRELAGELLIFMPIAFFPDKPTAKSRKGEASPCVEANVLVVTGTRQGEVFERAPFWQKVLVRQLQDRIGSIVPGRLTQGEARNDNNPPWQILKLSETEDPVADKALALKAYRAYKEQMQAREPDPFAA
jgi:hypothetical protein